MSSLQNLPGDVLGAIFLSLSPADRKALYHTHPSIWKSPAVNIHVHTAKLSGLPDRTLADQLASFPRHRTLTISITCKQTDDPELEAMLHQLLMIVTQPSTQLNTRLSTVDHLTFENCTLSEGCASSVAQLFPKLNSGAGSGAGCVVVFKSCSGSSEFFSALGPMVRVRELVFDCCSFEYGFERYLSTFRECLEVLTCKTRVVRNKIDSDSEEDSYEEYCKRLHVAAFKGLHRLKTLNVHNYTAAGLDVLLRAVPLTTLRLAGWSGWEPLDPMDESEELDEIQELDESEELDKSQVVDGSLAEESQASEVPPGVLFSNSLKFLHLGTVDPEASLSFVSAKFPALAELQLSGISCMQPLHNDSDEGTLACFKQLLSWLCL